MKVIQEIPVLTLKSVEDQKAIIERLPNFTNMFHDCYFNNYSVVAVNNDCSLHEYKEDTGYKMTALNDAFFVLQEFCETCFDQYEKNAISPGEYELTLLRKMRIVAEDWRMKYKAGGSFMAVDNAQFIVSGLNRLAYPFMEILHEKNNDEIRSGLVSLAIPYKAFIKIDVYLAFDVLYDFYGLLLQELHKYPALLEIIERIEIGKEYFPNTLLSNTKIPRIFPTLNIYLKKTLTSVGNRDVSMLVRKMQIVLNDFPEMQVDELYTKPLSKNMTIAQGFRNYKKILSYCNLLDRVYDHKSRYAFCKAG